MTKQRNRQLTLSLLTILVLLWAQPGVAAAGRISAWLVPTTPARAAGANPTLDEVTPAFRDGELLVKFQDDDVASAVRGRAVLRQAGAARLGIRRSATASTTELWQVQPGQELALAGTLSAMPDVVYAEPNYLVYAHLVPNDPGYTQQWGHMTIDSQGAWDVSTGASSVTVAVIDTGVDLDNPELQGRITGGASFVPGVSSPDDDQGHGTHVAGIIAAAGNNGLGIAGMAWDVQIMPIKVLDSDGVGAAGDVADGIRHAVDTGAHILNVSLGGPGASLTLQDAVAYARTNGVLIVGSAGNCGDGNYARNGCDYENQAVYPAAYDDEVLAVAATTAYDTVGSFSNRGSYVDVAAPGVDILSITPTGYAFGDGTSQAAPFVAGLAALMLSIDPALTPQQVENLIAATAVDLGATGWDPDYGAGRINAGAAVAYALGLQPPVLYTIANPARGPDFVVDWSDVAGATDYVLERGGEPDFGSPTTVYAGSASQASLVGQPMGTWYYRVRAEQDGNGLSSAWSETQSAIVGLNAPTLHPIDSGGTATYTVSWDGVPAATAYRVEESRSPVFLPATSYEVGAGLSRTYTDQEGGIWHYRVQAYNAVMTSLWSEPRSLTVVPQAPALLPIVTGVVSDAYTLAWSPVPGADGYRLQEAGALDFTDAITRYIGFGTGYQVTGQPNGLWHYRVQAVNAAGYSATSATESITVAVASLTPPVLSPILDDDHDGTYTITWTEVVSATAYILEESATPWFEAPTVRYSGPATQTGVIAQPIGPWHYRVRAQTPVGNSPWSTTESIVVPDFVYIPIVVRSP